MDREEKKELEKVRIDVVRLQVHIKGILIILFGFALTGLIAFLITIFTIL